MDSPMQLAITWTLNLAYLTVMVLAGPWVALRRLLVGKSLRWWPAKFLGSFSGGNMAGEPGLVGGAEKPVWIHAVSVGEVNLACTLIREMHRQQPDRPIVLTSSTDTGLALARQRFDATSGGDSKVLVSCCPWDFSWSIHRFLRRVQPACLVLVELEIWPNLVRLVSAAGIPVTVANGRLSANSQRGYRRVDFLSRCLFQRLERVLCQDAQYASRFIDCGCDPARVHVTGSVKYDGAPEDRNSTLANQLRQVAGLNAANSQHTPPIVLGGSTHPGEEQAVLEAYLAARQKHAGLRLILAPRHPERSTEVAQCIQRAGLRAIRRSQLGNDSTIDRKAWSNSVLLIDVVGELTHWWAVADVAFVGGSLTLPGCRSRGGQNMIEPAGLGTPVCFGPGTRNFRDVVSQLLSADAARVVQDPAELSQFIDWALTDAEAQAMAQRARQLVAAQRGATIRTINHLVDLLDPQPAGHSKPHSLTRTSHAA